MIRAARFVVALVAAIVSLHLLPPAPALAGITDTPLPTLPGSTGPAKLVFSVPGTVNAGALATVFTCTSLESSSVEVGVELFDGAGNLQNSAGTGDGALNTAPGQTVTFATASVVGLNADELVTSASGIGSARIVSDTSKLLCTARVVERGGNPPTLLSTLAVMKKTKQGGD